MNVTNGLKRRLPKPFIPAQFLPKATEQQFMAQFIQKSSQSPQPLPLTKQTKQRTSSGHARILICLQDRVGKVPGDSPALHTLSALCRDGSRWPFLTLMVKHYNELQVTQKHKKCSSFISSAKKRNLGREWVATGLRIHRALPFTFSAVAQFQSRYSPP